MWIVGDAFLSTIIGCLQNLRAKGEYPLHLYDHYNITAYYENPCSMTRSSLSRLLNALATGLNEKVRFPRYIIFIPDADILSTIDFYDFGMPITFEACIRWLFRQIEKFFIARKEDLRKQRSGSVGVDTRFIWVNVINRPAIRNNPNKKLVKVLAGRRLFNIALNEVIADTRYMHSMDLGEAPDARCFDRFGNLSAMGQNWFWKEIDHTFKKFDRHEISLKPEVPTKKKLPTPPKSEKRDDVPPFFK